MKRKVRNLTGPGWGLALAALVLAGCQNDGGPGFEDALAPAVSAELGDDAGPPSLGELKSVLNLTPEQAGRIGDLLEKLRSDRASLERPMRGERRRGPHGGRGFPGHDMPGPGAGQPDFEPPFLAFVEGVVDVLEPEQIVKLADYLSERRLDRMKSRAGREPGGGLHMRRMTEHLDLSREQGERMAEAMRTFHEGLRDLRIQSSEEKITAEQFRDSAKSLHADLESRLRSIVGDEKLGRLMEFKSRHRARITDRALDRLGTHVERRAEFLDRALDLTDAQETQVKGILTGALPEARALLNRIREGQLEPEDAAYEGYRLHESTREAVRDVLNPEQATVFDALKKMLPGHGRGMHH